MTSMEVKINIFIIIIIIIIYYYAQGHCTAFLFSSYPNNITIHNFYNPSPQEEKIPNNICFYRATPDNITGICYLIYMN